tara:strand:- start:661 stop:1398 length:738 start_codon:yes stop_codon:yes gene_type:complete
MDRRDDDSGAIAWPGFVDILSAVIIMFVFFVMITAIVMYVLSVEHKKNLSKENEQKLQQMVSEEMKDILEKIAAGDINIEELKQTLEQQRDQQTLEKENQKLSKENMHLEHEVAKLSGAIEQIKADFANNEEQDLVVDDNYFTILFAHNAITLSDETIGAINKYVTSKLENMPQNKDYTVRILACDNPNAPTITVSRELSLARALNIRNTLLANEIKQSKISFSYTESQKMQDSYNWIKIGVVPK